MKLVPEYHALTFDLPLQILEDPDGRCALRVEVRLLLLRLRRRELGVGQYEAFEYRRKDANDHLTLSLLARGRFHAELDGNNEYEVGCISRMMGGGGCLRRDP